MRSKSWAPSGAWAVFNCMVHGQRQVVGCLGSVKLYGAWAGSVVWGMGKVSCMVYGQGQLYGTWAVLKYMVHEQC